MSEYTDELDDIAAEMAEQDAEEAAAKAKVMAKVPDAVATGGVYFLMRRSPADIWVFAGFCQSPLQAEQSARALGTGEYKWGAAADLQSFDEPVSYCSPDEAE